MIQTWEGALYLASVIDLYSRRLIGYALAEHCKAPLVCDAPKMALATRGGLVAGVVIHNDRGSQYTSDAFTGELYPDVVDGPEKEGGVPSRLIKTDAGVGRQEGTPWWMFAGSMGAAWSWPRLRWMTSRGRALAG